MSEKIIDIILSKYHHNTIIYYIFQHQKLSDKWINNYNGDIPWVYLSENKFISEEFIEKNIDKINISYTIMYRSNKFIKDHMDKIDWDLVSELGSRLTISFIEEYIEYFNIDNIFKYILFTNNTYLFKKYDYTLSLFEGKQDI